jgi:TP901 family phage tail tape measure protein
MDVSFIIRLIDQVSQPAQKMRDAIGGIGEAARGMKEGFGQAIREGFSVENIENATKNAEQALDRARGRLVGALAMATTLAAPVVRAGQFDQSMRSLDKVLDVTSQRLQALRKFALDTSTVVPLAARDILELMSNAAQGGIPQEELEAFSLYVAKAAVAFDMAGGEIGERFAKLRNVYKLNQEGIEELGDASNHLSNNMAAKASELTDFANRAAGAATLLGLTAVEMSAVGAAMVSAGIVPETAARGFSALATKVKTGGKDIDAAFKAIGLNRKTWLKEMESDGPKAIQTLFEAMSTSPKGMDALVDLVGMDFSDDFAKLMGNPELLAQAFKLVSDNQAFAGSASDEAAKQAEGAEKKWQLFQNKLDKLAISMGSILLPAAIQMLDAVGDLAERVEAFAAANPELVGALVMAAASMLAFGIAARVAAYAIAAIRLPMIGLASTFLKFDEAGKNVSRGWMLMTRAGTMLGGAFGIVKGAALAVVTALGAVTAPVWLAVAAIVAAGFAVWKYWDRVSSFVSGFASVFAGLWDGVKSAAAGASDWVIEKIGSMLNLSPDQIAAAKEAFREFFDFSGWIDGAKQLLSDFWGWLGSFFSQEKLSDGEKGEMYAAGQNMGKALIDGIMSFIKVWISPIQALFKFALEIDWPEPPAWLKWLMERGGNLLEKGGELISGGGEKVTAAWDETKDWAVDIGGGGGPPPGVMAERSWSFDGIWSSLTGGADDASAGLAAGGQKGGDALAKGGQDAAQELRSAARDISAAASGLRSAAASARSGAGGGSVAGAISDSRTGALHGGTD